MALAAPSEAEPGAPTGGGAGRPLAVIPSTSGVQLPLGQPIIVRAPGVHPSAQTTSTGSPAPSDRTGDVTLNFAGADIRDVIAEVLGKTLKLNYVIDPEVSGSVTFNVSRPLPREDLLPTLEAVLNSQGATMVQADGIIRVVALPKDGKARAAVPFGRAPGAGAIGERTEVIPLRFIAAAEMLRLLEKVLPPGQVMVADEARRVLLVQGSADQLRVAEETVRIFDIDQLSGMSVALVPLRNGVPGALVGELQNIFGATHKEADSNVIRFMAIERLNAVMVLTRQPRYLDEARAWIERLDRARNVNERGLYVYYLQHSKAVPVAQTLHGALSGLNVQFKPPVPAAGPTGAPDFPGRPPPPGELATLPLASPGEPGALPQPIPNEQQPPLPPGAVRIEADEAHNALLISATARDYALIRKVLEGIDIPPLQVLIEVTVAEVVLNDSLRYGVQYFVSTGIGNGKGVAVLTRGRPTSQTSATVSALSQAFPGILPTMPGFALALTSNNLTPRVILEALSELTQTKVISTPRLLVLDNQSAQLQVGDVVPIITQSATSTITSNPLIVNNVQYKETGVVLDVTPQINTGGSVTMDIKLTDSNVMPTTSSTIDSPTISQRRLKSTISVKTGDSILLGGLIQATDNRDASGIPILHTLPLIGPLFGTRSDNTARTELIMLLTPYVISNNLEAQDITQSMERQFGDALNRATMVLPRVPPR
jgi:general secretion pathway protein D